MTSERDRRPSFSHAPPDLEEQLSELDPYNASFAFRPSSATSQAPVRSHTRNARKERDRAFSAFDSHDPHPLSDNNNNAKLLKQHSMYQMAPPPSSQENKPVYISPQLSPNIHLAPHHAPFGPLFDNGSPLPATLRAVSHAQDFPPSAAPGIVSPGLSSSINSPLSDTPLLADSPPNSSLSLSSSPPTPALHLSSTPPPTHASSSPPLVHPLSLSHAQETSASPQGVRRRPQLKLQVPAQPVRVRDPSPKAKSPTGGFIAKFANLNGPTDRGLVVNVDSPPASKFNIKLTAEDSKILRTLSRAQSVGRIRADTQEIAIPPPPSPPNQDPISFSPPQTPSLSLDYTTHDFTRADSGSFRRKNSAQFSASLTPIEGGLGSRKSSASNLEGLGARKSSASNLEGLGARKSSASNLEESGLPSKLSASTIPLEPGMVFPEGGGSFRRKMAGGPGSWDPAYAQGLEELEVEVPEKNPVMTFVKRAFFLLLRMHFLALLCSMVLTLYLGLYTPFVMTLDLQLTKDSTHTQFYNSMTVGNRLALGIGYGVHNAITGLFCFFLMIRIIGFDQVKFLLPFNLFLGVMMFCFVFVHYYLSSAYKSLLGMYSIMVEVLVGIQVIGTAALFGFRKNKLRSVTAYIASLTIALLIFVGILDFFGVPLFLSCSDFEKSIFRITVVPCLFIIKIVLVRVLCRITEKSGIYLLTDAGTFAFLIALIPVFVRAFYGRIFFVNVPSVGNLAWNAIVVEIFDIAFKLIHWNRRYLVRCCVKDIEKHKVLTPLMAHPGGDSLYALCLTFEKCIDIVGIAFAALLQFFNNKEFAANPSYGFTVSCFVVLYVVQTVSHFISIRLEVAHRIPVFQSLKNYQLKSVFVPLAISTLTICCICGWRGIFIINDVKV